MSASHVAFLRAVNVGKRRVEMARLRAAFVDLGHGDVVTYINSGNVVFTPTGPTTELELSIETHLGELFGFEIPTLVRTVDEVRAVVADQSAQPLPPGYSQHIMFLRREPSPADRATIEALSGGVDELRVVGREVRWRIHGGVSDSPLVTRLWVKAGQPDSTARNLTMLVKLLERFG